MIAAALLIGLASAAAPAPAAPAAAASNTVVDRRAIRIMHEYGTCVANRPRFRARQVLGYAPGSREEVRRLREISTGDCLEEQEGAETIPALSFAYQLMRGVVAEGLFEADFGSIGAPPLRATAVPFRTLSAQDIARLSEAGRRVLRGLDFANCIVAAAPGDAVALFATAPLSPEENAVFDRLQPHFPACLTQGAQLAIVKPQLRGLLAEAAYRAAYAASLGQAR